MKVFNLFILIVCISAIPFKSHATTYYADGTNGNDLNNGTATNPYKTISKAVSVANAGDTVIIQEGTYREYIVIINSGTQVNPIIIKGAPGKKVYIKGSNKIIGWISQGNGLWKKTGWGVNSQQLFVDGKPLQQIGSNSYWHTQPWGSSYILPPVGSGIADIFPGSFYYSAETQKLYCMLKDKSDPNIHFMEASVRDRVMHAINDFINYITIQNLNFSHANISRIWDDGLLCMSGRGWVVENCTFNYGDFSGLKINGYQHKIRRCRMENNGDSGVYIYHGPFSDNKPRQDILLEDLIITGNNYRLFASSWAAGGMKNIPGSRYVTVRGCYVADNHGNGIWFDRDRGGIVIENNIVVNNDGSGIFYEISGPSDLDEFGAVIRNNIVVGSSTQGIYIAASNGTIVENNTLYKNWAGVVVHGMPRDDHPELELKNNIVRNNIISESTKRDLVVYIGKKSGNNIINNNFYSNPNGLKFSIVTHPGYDVTHTNLNALYQDTGLGINSIVGDPKFVDPANHNFYLRPRSPARGKGCQGIVALVHEFIDVLKRRIIREKHIN